MIIIIVTVCLASGAVNRVHRWFFCTAERWHHTQRGGYLRAKHVSVGLLHNTARRSNCRGEIWQRQGYGNAIYRHFFLMIWARRVVRVSEKGNTFGIKLKEIKYF